MKLSVRQSKVAKVRTYCTYVYYTYVCMYVYKIIMYAHTIATV